MGRPRTPVGMKCGTASGYRVHEWHKEDICAPCSDAYHKACRIYTSLRASQCPWPIVRMTPINALPQNAEARKIAAKKRKALWFQEHKEQACIRGSRRRALKLNAPSEQYTTQQILDLYGTDCHICKEPIDLSAPRQAGRKGWEMGLHLEHVIPLILGGTDLIENVKPSHGICNITKSSRLAF